MAKIIAQQIEISKSQQVRTDLNLILNKWKFGDEVITSADQFIDKFAPWVDKQLAFQKEVNQFLTQQGVKDLKELTKKLKEDLNQQKITDLENKLADTKAELTQTKREWTSLLKSKEELENKVASANTQLDTLSSLIEKDTITNKNWKKEVSTFVNTIKGIIKEEMK